MWLRVAVRLEPQKDLLIRPFRRGDSAEVVQLWERCGLTVAWNDSQADIQRKLQVQPELFLVATLEERIVGTVMGGYDGHRGWINYLAVSPDRQHQGIGRRLMEAVQAGLLELGCPKINLMVRRANANVVGFYERLGFVVEDRVSLGKRLG